MSTRDKTSSVNPPLLVRNLFQELHGLLLIVYVCCWPIIVENSCIVSRMLASETAYACTQCTQYTQYTQYTTTPS
jgi:hypothetical protein